MRHYRILKATNEDTMAEYVEKAINDSWELAGPLNIVPRGTDVMFYQPIMKFKREHPNPGPKR